MSVENVISEVKGLGNIINWNPNNNINFSATATVDISRSVLNNNEIYGDYVSYGKNIALTTNSILDYNIDMREHYKYKLKFDYDTVDEEGNPVIDEKFVYMKSLSEQVSNCSASYSYATHSISVNWNHIKSYNNDNGKLNESTLSYNVWICRKSDNNDLVRFETNTTSFTITNNITGKQEDTETNTTFTIQKGLYFIYVTPKFVTIDPQNNNTYTRGLTTNIFKISNGSIVATPQARVLIDPKSPTNFKITSSYNAGKISFSWVQPVTNNNTYPSQYRLDFTNTTTTPNILTTKTISGNKNTYTLDNTDLSTGALQPGNYTVSLCGIYNSLMSDLSTTLNFNIPVTKINFSQKLVDQYGNVTTNIKNGVSGIILNWNSFSYATYYKITVQQFDEQGNTQNTETYYTNNNTISLAWHFPTKKSKFIFNISYSSDTSLNNNPPTSSTNALGQSYLDSTGNYDPLFTATNNNNNNLNAVVLGPPVGGN